MRTSVTVGLISIFLGAFTLYFMGESSYMKDEYKNVCVEKKYTDTTTHKGRVRTHHYLVMKDDKGRLFDRDVSVTLFTTKDQGSCFKFMLREFDIQQTTKDNILFFFLPIIVGSFFIAVGITFSVVYPLTK